MTIRIVHERPDYRRHLWVAAPLGLAVEGVAVPALEWSLGGVRLWRLPESLAGAAAGTRLALHVNIPFQGFEIGFPATGEIEDAGTGGEAVVVRFVDLGERERELLAHFIEELVRGEMAPVGDTIQRIDLPVLPLPVRPGGTTAGEPRRLRPLRTAVATLLYLTLGAGLLGYLGLVLYRGLFWQEVGNAAISGPVASLTSQGSGHVVLGSARPGDMVAEGEVLARVHDNALERDTEFARIAGFEREAKLDFLRQRLVAEKGRMTGFGTVESQNVRRLELEKQALGVQLAAAERELRQLRAAPTRTQARDVGDATRRIAELKKQIEIKSLEQKTRSAVKDGQDGRHMLVGQNLVGNIDDLEAQLKLAEAEVEFAERRLAVYLENRERLEIRAPFDGRLAALPKIDGSGVERGDVVAVVERHALREVTAYLRPEEAMHVGIGDTALVHVSALRDTLKARVTRIDQAGHHLVEAERWSLAARRAADKGVAVVLAFDDPERAADTARLAIGMPAMVILERPDRQALRRQIDSGLNGLATGARDTIRYIRRGLVQAMIDGAGEPPAAVPRAVAQADQ